MKGVDFVRHLFITGIKFGYLNFHKEGESIDR